MRFVVCVALLAGCYDERLVECGDRVCPHGKVCGPGDSCVTETQLSACDGMADGASCDADAIAGVCSDGLCIEAGCGNGLAEPGEVCDDGNRSSLDGCRGDCQSAERCGDGVVEFALGEQCDCGDAVAIATCSSVNSVSSDAECRTDCTTARCGDAITDHAERCDDGNHVDGDGCRADCTGRFAKIAPPAAYDFYDVQIHEHEIWLTSFAGGGHTYHFDGASWSELPYVTFVLAGDGTPFWCTTQPQSLTVYRFEAGAVHSTVYPTTQALADNGECHVTGATPTDFVANVVNAQYSAGYTLRYSAGAFVDLGPSIVAGCGRMLPATTRIGATYYAFGYVDGAACRFDGTTWSQVGTDEPAQRLFGHGDDLYIERDYRFLHWTGTAWVQLPDVPGSYSRVIATGEGELIGVADAGIVYRFDGTAWSILDSPTEQRLIAVDATSPSNVVIAGENGALLH